MTVGDGYQNGGCLVVGAGGNPTMYTYIQVRVSSTIPPLGINSVLSICVSQEEAADHPENSNILEALGIQTA